MKIWLDDQCDDQEAPRRHPPEGFIGVKNLAELEALLKSNTEPIEVIDFDHDLGENEPDGYKIARWLAHNYQSRWPREVRVHSTNPCGAQNILAFAERFRKWRSEEARRLEYRICDTCRSVGKADDDLCSWCLKGTMVSPGFLAVSDLQEQLNQKGRRR